MRIDDLLKRLKGLYRSLAEKYQDRLQVFLVDFPLYNSTYRIGPSGLVVQHLFCQPSAESPVFLCTEGNPIFKSYVNQLQQLLQSQYIIGLPQ